MKIIRARAPLRLGLAGGGSQNGLDYANKAWGAEAAWETLAKILSELGFKGKGRPHTLPLNFFR